MLLCLLSLTAVIQLVYSACQQVASDDLLFGVPAGVCSDMADGGNEYSYTITCSGSAPTMNAYSGLDCSGTANTVAMDGVCTGSGACDYIYIKISMDNDTTDGSCSYSSFVEFPYTIGECDGINATHSTLTGCAAGDMFAELYDNTDCSGNPVQEVNMADDGEEDDMLGTCISIRCGGSFIN
eukprot:UN08585